MSITFFDTETSGLVDTEVIQAAYLSTDVQFKRLDNFEKLFSCSKPIEWDAMALHGITNEQLYLKDKWEKHSGVFIPKNTIYLVAHNAAYDTKFFKPEHLANVNVLCTLKLARKLIDKSLCGSHKNGTLFYYLGCYKDPILKEYLGKTHTALSDCAMTANILHAMLKKFNLTIEQAYQLVNGQDTPEQNTIDISVCFFKKHYGTSWKEVIQKDRDYVQWLLTGNKIQDKMVVEFVRGLL